MVCIPTPWGVICVPGGLVATIVSAIIPVVWMIYDWVKGLKNENK